MKNVIFAVLGALLVCVVAVQQAVAQNSYRIKPGDTVTVEVLEDPSLNRSVLVLPDGSISFPYAGTLEAGNRTIGELQTNIAQAIASNFATQPTVFVTVNAVGATPPPAGARAPATIDVYFLGEVNNPGLIQMARGTTFLQAMAQGGGFSKFAAVKRVQLRRTDSAGRQNVYTVNYRDLSNGAALENDIVLQDGDVILVPERRLFE